MRHSIKYEFCFLLTKERKQRVYEVLRKLFGSKRESRNRLLEKIT